MSMRCTLQPYMEPITARVHVNDTTVGVDFEVHDEHDLVALVVPIERAADLREVLAKALHDLDVALAAHPELLDTELALRLGAQTPEPTDAAQPQTATVIAGIEVELAPGEPQPATSDDERRTLSQLTILGRVCDPARLDVSEIEQLFLARYGHELRDATKQQTQEFTIWLRGAIDHRTVGGAVR